MVSFPPPLNIFTFAFIPFLLLLKSSRLNGYLFRLCYWIQILAPMFVLFQVLNLVSLPFTFLKMYQVIVQYNYKLQKLKRIKRQSLVLRGILADCILWTTFGIPWLLYQTLVNDSLIFLKSSE